MASESTTAELFEDDLVRRLLERAEVRLEVQGDCIVGRLYDSKTGATGHSTSRVRVSGVDGPLSVGGRTVSVVTFIAMEQESY